MLVGTLALCYAAAARIDQGDLTALLYAHGIGRTSLWRDRRRVDWAIFAV